MAVFAGSNTAHAATSSTLNFQGRLLTNSGGLVPDGSYNIEFKLYNASAIDGGETLVQGACQTNPGPIADEDCLWVESRTGGDTVTVQNGYFSVNLGSVTAFGGTINWDQELWLGMNIGGVGAPTWDGEMTPRFKLTAVPYAFRAGALVDGSGNAKDADDFAQLAPSSVQTVSVAIAALRLNQTGAGSLLQLQGDGSDVFTVDKLGNTVLGAGITVGNSSSTTAGTIRWNGSAFQGYNGSSWTSLGSSAVMPFVSKTKITSETQNIVVNPTATLQPDDELFFSIGANETWNYRFLLHITTNATPDIKFSVTAPVGATCVNGVSDNENAISVANLGCGVSSGNIASLTATDVYEVSGSITNGANAGTVTLNWAQNTANAANTIVRAGSYVEASRSVGGSSVDVAFIQDGNAFGGLAVLGTNDANGLAFETDGVERMQILSAGDIQAKDDLIANRITTGVTGTTSGTGTNTTTLTLVADSFSLNDVIFIDNVGQDYYTRITVDGGGGTYTVSPAVTFENGRTVTSYTIQNIGATTTDYASQANRFFQGYFLGGVVIGAGSTTIGDGSIESTTALNIQSGGGDVNIGGALVVTGAITGDGSGITNIDGSVVDGSTISALNASNISSGTLNDARLSSNVTLLGNSFNGVNQLVQLDGSGNLPVLNGAAITNLSAGNITGALAALDGSALTSLNASNISSGTLADGRLSTNVTLLGNTFNGASQLIQLDASGNLPALDGAALISLSAGNLSGALAALDGSALTSLNASNIASGTVADARLSANVTLQGNTFNGVNQLVRLGASSELPALNGAGLTSLTAANLTGAIAALDGSALTSLNASNIASGTLADGRLSANVTLLGNTFNGSSQLVQLDASGNLPILNGAALTSLSAGNLSGALPSISGANLTSLNASNISSGTLNDGRLSANVALLNGGQTFSALTAFGAGLSATGDINATGAVAGATVSGDGSALTTLNGSNISSGTVADGRLSANVALLTGTQTFSGSKTFSSGLVLGQTTITSSAAVARAVDLPDETGTICLSNKDTCGYIRLASGSTQTDATANNTISINKTNATGNLIDLQRSGGVVFTVANSGALQIQATSAVALDIRNSSGDTYFLVDTNTGSVQIGSTIADAMGVLFVLDTKNTAGDPTGADGGIYYNSNTGKFRCFEDGSWKDCIGTRQIRSFVDTTADAAADNNTTNYWDTAAENNNSVPNLSPSSTNKSITGSVSFETRSTTTADRSVVARVERSIGAPANCNSGTPVGTILSTFTTNNGEEASNTMVFLDNPNTTSTVYYTLCADTATSSAGNMIINRIRITLEEANNSN